MTVDEGLQTGAREKRESRRERFQYMCLKVIVREIDVYEAERSQQDFLNEPKGELLRTCNRTKVGYHEPTRGEEPAFVRTEIG